MILLNIAEDLKSYAKVTVRPGEPSKTDKKAISNAKKSEESDDPDKKELMGDK